MISSKVFKDINKYFNKHVNYSKLTSDEYKKLISDINIIIQKYDIKINPHTLMLMYDTFIYLLSKSRGTYAHRIGENIFLDYENKINIMDISKKYELPPMSIVRQILIEKKHESHNIEKIIRKQNFPKNIQSQMPIIVKNDPSFWFINSIPNIHPKLIKLKCPYILKNDLKKQGKVPDVLFNKECIYGKKKFSWIVFKPYILFDNNLHLHDIKKTINNFDRFGTGLILYNDIVCSKNFIKKINAHIDDYKFLD